MHLRAFFGGNQSEASAMEEIKLPNDQDDVHVWMKEQLDAYRDSIGRPMQPPKEEARDGEASLQENNENAETRFRQSLTDLLANREKDARRQEREACDERRTSELKGIETHWQSKFDKLEHRMHEMTTGRDAVTSARNVDSAHGKLPPLEDEVDAADVDRGSHVDALQPLLPIVKNDEEHALDTTQAASASNPKQLGDQDARTVRNLEQEDLGLADMERGMNDVTEVNDTLKLITTHASEDALQLWLCEKLLKKSHQIDDPRKDENTRKMLEFGEQHKGLPVFRAVCDLVSTKSGAETAISNLKLQVSELKLQLSANRTEAHKVIELASQVSDSRSQPAAAPTDATDVLQSKLQLSEPQPQLNAVDDVESVYEDPQKTTYYEGSDTRREGEIANEPNEDTPACRKLPAAATLHAQDEPVLEDPRGMERTDLDTACGKEGAGDEILESVPDRPQEEMAPAIEDTCEEEEAAVKGTHGEYESAIEDTNKQDTAAMEITYEEEEAPVEDSHKEVVDVENVHAEKSAAVEDTHEEVEAASTTPDEKEEVVPEMSRGEEESALEMHEEPVPTLEESSETQEADEGTPLAEEVVHEVSHDGKQEAIGESSHNDAITLGNLLQDGDSVQTSRLETPSAKISLSADPAVQTANSTEKPAAEAHVEEEAIDHASHQNGPVVGTHAEVNTQPQEHENDVIVEANDVRDPEEVTDSLVL